MDTGRKEENRSLSQAPLMPEIPGAVGEDVEFEAPLPAGADPEVHEALRKYGYKLTPSRRKLLQGVVARRSRHFALVLEDLKDPHNISAVIRTSEVFGFQDVHVINEVNPYRVTRSVLKGSYKWLDVFCHARRAACLDRLRAAGYRIAVASTAAEASLYDLDLSRPTAFYLGSETMGNHPDTLAKADLRFRIPQHGLTESMNVSVCAGVIAATLDRWLRERGREHFVLSAEAQAALLAAFYERSAVGVDRNSPIHYLD
jgi:tRNA (guanosine-2'-O-)-methyltransferase